ncbi:MAG: penicillin acylase family protein [Myxococcota bacterium]
MRISTVVALAVLPTLSSCALFTLAATKRSHPSLDGAMTASGVQADLTIRRDANGVPHIQADSEQDAWFGLGYVHAQDRLFQLDLNRRIAHGHVSELLGERALDLDTFVGSMRLQELGQGAVDNSSPETKMRIAAYTAGVNAGAASLPALPVEYRLLGAEFTPFDHADTTAFLYLMGWSLQENLDHELASMALGHLPSKDLGALFQTHPDTPEIDPFWEDLRTSDFGELSPGFKAFTGALGGRAEGRAPATSEASNNWVVSGDRTASGKPIVANDPHLVQRVPSLWYAAHLKGGDLHVAGATLPGVAAMPIGHNEDVAWGFTNVMADTVDLAVLERKGDQVVIGGTAETPVPRSVTIHPRGGDVVTREVLWTTIGPIINQGGDHAIALRWVAFDLEDRTPDVLTHLAHATSVQSIETQVMPLASILPQNIVMADQQGNIGWSVLGSIPRRHGFTGRVPHPGSDNRYHWDGTLQSLPGETNPEAGYAVTANHKPDADQPNVDAIATLYLPRHRYDRIESRLKALPKATPQDMHEIQLDVRENAAATFLPTLLDGVTPTSVAKPCFTLLSDWDHQATVDSPAAAVWAVFQEELFRAMLSDRVDAEQMSLLLDIMSTGRNVLDGDYAHFWTDRPAQVGGALERTCERLNTQFGSAPEATWGQLHPLELPHPFSAQSGLLSGWDMRSTPFPGTGASVAAADYNWAEDEWKVGFMASMRLVMPLDDFNASTFVHPGGQSGQPKSPYYRSHYESFVGGQTLPLWFDEASVNANAVHTLVISP